LEGAVPLVWVGLGVLCLHQIRVAFCAGWACGVCARVVPSEGVEGLGGVAGGACVYSGLGEGCEVRLG
jgi:hypothetical protein